MIFKNAYFITGTAYAGKSTMINLLEGKYDGILCEENYHDRFFPAPDKQEYPNLHCGFPVLIRDDDRTVQQTLTLVEWTFGLG